MDIDNVAVVIVGVDQWERFTLPLLVSIKGNERYVPVFCVDNGSKEPYPKWGGVSIIRSNEIMGYAAGINFGIRFALEQVDAEWFVVLNNDVLVKKPFVENLLALDPKNLYGFYTWKDLFDWDYLSSWCLFISKNIWDQIGQFDEAFYPMYFEDADYSKRVLDAGYDLICLEREEWGFYHLNRWLERKKKLLEYDSGRAALRKYLIEKYEGDCA